MISRLLEKLRDLEYRKGFVASQINIGIPFQIRALLRSRGKTQEWLADRTGMRQPRISGLVTPGKTRPNIETLRRVAEAFDCGLMVRFVPFSEMVRWSDEFDPEHFDAPSFSDDSGLIERKEAREALAVWGATHGPYSSLPTVEGCIPRSKTSNIVEMPAKPFTMNEQPEMSQVS